jgi:hypothetical protein
MEMPKPQAEHQRLSKFAGTWVGEEKLFPSPWDPKGGTATAKVEAQMGLDGFFLITNYTETREGQVTYRGHGVSSYDQDEKCYVMFWFDSIGVVSPSPAKGKWEGSRLIYTHQTKMGHSRYTYDLQGEGRYKFTIENSQDGQQWAPFMEAHYTRK